MIYKINFALTFLGSGKIRLQNGPRSRISGIGKNSFTKRTSLSHFWDREKFVYKTNFFCYTILSKGF